MEPSHYIVLKGVLSLYEQHEASLTMALENGVTLMMRAIDAEQPLYINSNHLDEELIFSAQGKLEEGLSEFEE
jgi:hypothetical protein